MNRFMDSGHENLSSFCPQEGPYFIYSRERKKTCKKNKMRASMVAHACNLRYSGDRVWKDCSLRPAWEKKKKNQTPSPSICQV
jgi:hypothetical protein